MVQGAGQGGVLGEEGLVRVGVGVKGCLELCGQGEGE